MISHACGLRRLFAQSRGDETDPYALGGVGRSRPERVAVIHELGGSYGGGLLYDPW